MTLPSPETGGDEPAEIGHDEPVERVSPGRAFLIYSLLRLVLLVVSYAVLLAIGLGGLLALGAAVLMSALLSLVLLRDRRDAFTRASIARSHARRELRAERRARLDEGPLDDPGSPA